MSILAANPCRQKAPTVWSLDALSDLEWIKQPQDGDIAVLIEDGDSQFWKFQSHYEGETDDWDAISGGCQGAWISGGTAMSIVTFGGVGDGESNSTLAAELAYGQLALRGGGALFIPFAPNRFLFNLTINTDNILIVGSGVRGVRENTTIGVGPWDLSRPVIQVGNDTRYVDGFGMRDLGLFGNDKDGNPCPGCLHFVGGAYNGDVEFCQFIGGTRTVYFKAGMFYPCTLNGLSHCVMWEGLTSTVEIDDTRLGPDPEQGFCTGTKFATCYINGSNTVGHAIKIIRGKGNFEGVYMDASSNHGIWLETGGNISSYNCDWEVESTTGVLVEVNFPGETYSERDIARFIQGGGRMQGKVRWTDQNGSVEQTLPIIEFTANEPSLRKPYVALPMKLGDVATPYGIFEMDRDGLNLVLRRLDAASVRLKFEGDNEGYILAGDDDTAVAHLFIDFLSTLTQRAQVELFRSTNTTGDCFLEVYPGNNTALGNHRLSGKATSYLSAISGNIGIGTNSPDPAAKLEIASNASGVLFPRMTQAQRDLIPAPPNALVIFNVDTDKLQVRVTGAWDDMN